MKKISVIIPCYNSEKTIARCLSSILNQTYQNYEVLVIDDGSTDATTKEILKFIAIDSRIILLKKENGGVGSARNLGLQYATGDYIEFIDSDDDIEPKTLETLINNAINTNSDMVICKFTHTCFTQFLEAGEYYMNNPSDFEKVYSDFFSVIVTWNKLFRKETINHFFDESLKIFEDCLFILDTLKNTNKVLVIDDYLYNYYDAGIQKNDASLVNSFLNTEFWKTNNSYWYKLDNLKPMVDIRLNNLGYFNKIIEYRRSFDMAFWELSRLIYSNCSREICIAEMYRIFNEDNFILSLQIQSHNYSGTSIDKVAEFIDKCFLDYQNKRNNNVGFLVPKFVENFFLTCVVNLEPRLVKNLLIDGMDW